MDTQEVNETMASMIPPLKQADQLLQEAIQLSNKGVDWEGQSLGEVGSTIENITIKLENLKRILNITQEPEQEPVSASVPR